MARSFSNLGTALITTGLSASSTQRSFSIWAYRLGDGGGDFGRMFDRQLSTDNELFWCDGPSNHYEYQVRWSGAQARWTIPKPATGTWFNFVVTYDSSSTANNPIIYQNGASQTVTRLAAPSGSLSTAVGPYIIGNRAGTSNRGWYGYLAEFAVWNRILTSGEAAAIGANKRSPLQFRNGLVSYVPLKYDLRDWVRNVFAAATGATNTTHPTIYEAASTLLVHQ